MTLFAAVVWSGIGIMIIRKGLIFLVNVQSCPLCVLVGAGVVACIKTRMIMDPAAQRGIEHVHTLNSSSHFWEVFPVKTRYMIVCMMGISVVLKYTQFPDILKSFVYLSIGPSLLASSRLHWLEWLRRRGIG
ncbi:MAG: hypothetical protein CSA20_03390 [Deltaproteobacteria bacterium]|nr:MAG: hypothetical protein CSB23_02620 [Deltaproteobacteria bacterium]PIE73144.1 MAG: hypothetical protein CSA20_03390 [Deltaproteobacteria bacterium]